MGIKYFVMLSNSINTNTQRNYQTECLLFRRFLLARGHKVHMSRYTIQYKAKTLWFTKDGIIPITKDRPNHDTTLIQYSNPWYQYNKLIEVGFYDFMLNPAYQKKSVLNSL